MNLKSFYQAPSSVPFSFALLLDGPPKRPHLTESAAVVTLLRVLGRGGVCEQWGLLGIINFVAGRGSSMPT